MYDNEKLEKDLAHLMNIHGVDNLTDTSDYVLAEYLMGCISNYMDIVLAKREESILSGEVEWMTK